MKQKSENQKALPKFLGILVIASLVGGVLGGLSGAAGYFLKGEELGAAITRLLSTASPWAMALCATVLLGSGFYQYRRARTAFRSWDSENEDVIQRAEERLSLTLLLDSLTVIASFFFFQCRNRLSAAGGRQRHDSTAGDFFGCHCTVDSASAEDCGSHQGD